MAGQPPDYTDYIAHMSRIGNQGFGWAVDLQKWAQETGVDLKKIAEGVSGKATAAADSQQAASDRLMSDWEKTYSPIYKAQAGDAQRMLSDLPAYEEHVAGEFEADMAQKIDAAKATQMRNMRSQGFSPSKVASQAIDTTAGLQRAAALTAAGQEGRKTGRLEAREVAANALYSGSYIPGVASTQGGMATANRNQATNAPLAAASTTAGLYSPSISYMNSSLPYLKTWGDTMARSYDQQLAKEKLDQDGGDDTFGSVLGAVGTIGGAVAGAYFGGPAGASVGSSLGGKLGSSIGSSVAAKGGRIPGRRYEAGGAIDTGAPQGYVPPEASPSGGEQVDDVPAMVSAGEFVIPKRTVDWLGDKFFQKLIMKTDQEIDQQTVAAPEEGPPMQAMETQAPMFRSEGART